MYKSCIFCSAPLGQNEVIEYFPVGRTLAFDAEKGRLWVVCGSCHRWNLSPIEERWEAVEEAERTFRSSRLRVQEENIGLAKCPDGTRLIRVGEALEGELAAWRYGRHFLARRRNVILLGGAGAVALAFGLGPLAAVAGGTASMWWLVPQVLNDWQRRRVVLRTSATDSTDGKTTLVRRWHVEGSYLEHAGNGVVNLRIPDVHRKKPKVDWRDRPKYTDQELVLAGAEALTALRRSMIHVNRSGASRGDVRAAVGLLGESGSADEYLAKVARRRAVLGKRSDMEDQQLRRPDRLALEMALHEESERRALRGELAILRSAWQEAEEIAAIADVLPFDPLDRLRGLVTSTGRSGRLDRPL
jgi:hypothetical protein